VTISSDFSLQHHVSNVSATSFYWFRQLRRVRRSLESSATLVHTFVTSRVDQCNAILAEATKSVTDTLQRVMNAATRVVSDTRKFDRGLTQILYDDLKHWLDVTARVMYKLGIIMHRCRHGKAPQYLVDCCTPVSDVVGRQRLRSATQQLMVPRHRLSTVGRRAFVVHGSMVWNSLPDDLCFSNHDAICWFLNPSRYLMITFILVIHKFLHVFLS